MRFFRGLIEFSARNMARTMNDECIEAQALYSLGATSQLMENPREAIQYYLGKKNHTEMKL